MKTLVENTVQVGSYNIGVYQSMLTCGEKETHLCAIDRILTTCAEQNLDIMSLCELGGHKEGTKKAINWSF